MKKVKTLGFFIFLLVLAILIIKSVDLYEKIEYPVKYDAYIAKYCAEYDVDKDLMCALIKTESGFNPHAVSDMGAIGLTQITEDTFDWIKAKLGDTKTQYQDLKDPETSIKYGTYLMSMHLKEYGNTEVALAAYHAGRRNVNKWLSEGIISLEGNIEKLPIEATQHYVKKVMTAYRIYQKDN
ncbi:MAG: lytic transglycosylase domain-containing protein [Oscillospiraceae bacterium]|nr:lytic transglycosylase domain-containing protein [Oscillospiraceae bacterium]